jgi:UDP-glucuronate 4-epimerase
MNTILVTGAAGFIGFHLIEALLPHGYKVIGIDSLNDYYDVELKYDRLNESGIDKNRIKNKKKILSKKNSNYTFIKQNITELSSLNKLFAEENFEIVLNLAAQAGVRYSLDNPNSYVESNLVGFVNVLECCRHFKTKHLIYASSSSVYGNNMKTPFSEDDCVDFPISLYAATKKANELMAHVYSHLYKLPTTGLRFFTVYGPWGRPDMAPTLFATAIKNTEAIKVYNEGQLERDFTYIDDIVNGIIKLISFPPDASNEHPYYQLFNIGNSHKVKLLDFISVLEEKMGKTAEKILMPMQPGDVNCTWSDLEKIKKLTGYFPRTELNVGLERFVNWFNEYY